MIESKSGSGVRPSRCARAEATRAGQLVTIRAMPGSGIQSISSAAAGPATLRSAAAISATVTVSAGRLTAVRPPHSSSVAVAARISPLTALAGDASATSVAGSTGQTARSPASGSRMMPDMKPDAAAFGLPGRTLTVTSRSARPRRKPLRV